MQQRGGADHVRGRGQEDGKVAGKPADQTARARLLARFARALSIPPHVFGLASSRVPLVSSTVTGEHGGEDDEVRRRQLLASFGVTAAATAAARVVGPAAMPDTPVPEELLLTGMRDAMLGLAPGPSHVSAETVREALRRALEDFHGCRYQGLARTLPRLVSAGHQLTAAGGTAQADELLAGIYTLTTRMLIKADDQQLGWMAADRARVLAASTGNPLMTGEAARNLAVLARKAGWHDQAASIALTAAASPGLRGNDYRLAAERGLLIQSAAYTAARVGDRDGMRELTGQAAAVAARLPDGTLLRDHGGGFTPVTVELHRISAENYAGDPGMAIAAARRITPRDLPTTERRARYWTDTARAFASWDRRDECLHALQAAEREAPEEIRSRPAVRAMISSLLVTGRTSPELRELAQRCGIT